MGTRSEYGRGVFCWIDLATSDTDAAEAFYEALFGWDYDERDAGDGQGYTMAKANGLVAAGLMGLIDDGPPRWQSYISVDSAVDTVDSAEAAGATIIMAPTDVGTAGRMAVIQDPSDAVVSIWEAGVRRGAEVVNEPGALCWNDLMTHDVGKAVNFYREVFGWELDAVEGAPGERQSIRVGKTLNGGMAEIPDQMGSQMPPNWLACFAVDDVEAMRHAAQEHGGRAVTDVLDLPTGRFVVVIDPQGAAFGIIDGEMDP